ncbi:protein containing 4Fe-4S dicluster domain [Lentimicrobium saccharophilum]|uniref:Protein containing 4Fe-4S dicluster domain n=1 Tax=Lentimicrobium saccharophilum TaxID=1678841 RepID=A0A0S7C235_9BACT|nr:4Fe-4S binding protein [Lentimicrobium saccharophilum]GAP44903.1 protein containing 4Fe-4S dicluster domain [Lentimicrobium saccharophilum]
MRSVAWPRKARIALSLVFLLFTGVIFLDPARWIPVVWLQAITWPQFTPSLLKFLITGGWAAAGFLLFVVITLVFGRIYCSTVCPLGTLQDIIFRIRRRILRQKPLRYARPQNILRHIILIIVIISIIAGSALLVNFLDPYSNFGRIMANLFRPVVLTGNNAMAAMLEKQDIFWLPRTPWKGYQLASLGFAAAFFVLVAWMSAVRGRLYCNTVCPVGALLSLFSRVSLFRISLDKQLCNSCGQCSKVCKAQCIDVKNREVDYSRCVACFNCITACPSSGVVYGIVKSRINNGKENFEAVENGQRRTLLKAFMVGTAFLSTRAFAIRLTGGEKPTTIPEQRSLVSSPPGSEGHDHFNMNCTACHLCVSACPTHVLQPSFLEYGLQGLMQPYMDYHSGFCNFECTVCSDICPTGAILPLVREQKKRVQLGVAVFIKENCVVYTDETDCGACSEHCPTKAVDMVPYKDGLTIPEVDDKICIGCGACEYACPTRPFRAIFVEGNRQHIMAEEPQQEEIILKDTGEDFPF